MAKDLASTVGFETGQTVRVAGRIVRVPYRSFGAGAKSAEQGQCAAGATTEEAFADWSKRRNRRLVQLAKGRPLQPPEQPLFSGIAMNGINNRSENNRLLNRMRVAVSDAPDAAMPRDSALPGLSRSVHLHPFTRPPVLPGLSRRNFPSLVVLMILAWVAVVGAGVYKGLRPPSGFILSTDR